MIKLAGRFGRPLVKTVHFFVQLYHGRGGFIIVLVNMKYSVPRIHGF
ncbi:hypothetical protein [Sphingobacterium mizutaii]|nr:hypothetical protein [Sphingobacterium mizutaii]